MSCLCWTTNYNNFQSIGYYKFQRSCNIFQPKDTKWESIVTLLLMFSKIKEKNQPLVGINFSISRLLYEKLNQFKPLVL
jgi:hypothetical protein